MRLDDVIEILKALPLFRGVDSEALRLLGFSAIRRQLRPGDILFRRGDPSEGAFLVLSGEIVLDRQDDGSPSPFVFGPGTLIGQTALFALIERPATAIARDATSLLLFTRDLMFKVLDAHPRAAQQVQAALAAQLKETMDKASRVTL